MIWEGNVQSSTNPIIDHLDLWSSVYVKKAATGRGSNSKISPYGTQKLRDLILELAVRGKLVSQDPNEEPACVLLERIVEEKKKLIKEGRLKKRKQLPNIDEEDKLFDLPKGWEWSRLGAISQANTGYAFKSTEYVESGTFVLRVTNINPDGTINQYDNKYIDTESAETTYKKFRLDEGDVLLVMVGGSLGKLGVVSKNCLPAVLNQNMWKLDRFGDMNLKYFLMGLFFINKNQLKITSSTHGHLSQGEYMDKLFPVPPLKEQHRIAAKVDELMALCDQLEQQQTDNLQANQTLVETLLRILVDASDAESTQQAWNRIAEHFDTLFTTEESIDQLKQTILQLAVMGKLVQQDPNDEPASVLQEKISTKRKELVRLGKLKKQKTISEVSEEEKHFELPDGWEFVRFGEVTFNRDAERIPVSVEERRGRQGEYDYYGASGVIDSIDDFLFDKPLLLIGEDGANLVNRSTPIAFMAYGKYWVNNHAHVIDGLTEGLLHYIALHINAISLEPYVTGTAQPKMNQAKMNLILLALPPEKEQKRIVTKVDELMALCDALKTYIQKAQETQAHLADAVVEQAVA